MFTCELHLLLGLGLSRCRSVPLPPARLLLAACRFECRLLYWTAADGAGRREAFDALSDAILCLGSTATSRWTAQAAALRRVQAGGIDDLPSVRTAASEVSLHRVSLSDEPEQLLMLSR